MGLKVKDDAPTSLTLYKRVGEYVDGTPRTGDAISFGPGDEIPAEYAVYIKDAYTDDEHPEHAHITSFVEGTVDADEPETKAKKKPAAKAAAEPAAEPAEPDNPFKT